MSEETMSRRTMLKRMLGGMTAAVLSPTKLLADTLPIDPARQLITKPIYSSGEPIPVIGMGTWKTFNVGSDPQLRKARTKVLKAFFANGGAVIDSSPMYGTSQKVVGYGLKQLNKEDQVFPADKIWTWEGDATRKQTAATRKKWNVETLDLMQIHNLVAWQEHLPTLRAMKETGMIRYIGITTSHGRRHDEFERIMKSEPLDFVQFTYNMIDRRAEQRLLPLARERDIAVIANRPFRGGSLIDRLQYNDYPLPDWATDIDCANWPQFLLKFIVSHPAVTCAIPATTKVEHMRENMGAAYGPLPNADMRQGMLDYLQSLL